jgi:hypothetical protein
LMAFRDGGETAGEECVGAMRWRGDDSEGTLRWIAR